MRKTLTPLLLTLSLAFLASGCYTLKHRVGNGGTGSSQTSERQWYALWGLVPLNDVESEEMAGSATDYTITSQISPLDIVINFFTGWLTVYSQTVTVER